MEGGWITGRDKGGICKKPRQRRKKDAGKVHRAIRILGELLDLKPRREQFPVRLRKSSEEKPEKQGSNPPLARPAAHSLSWLPCHHCLLLCSPMRRTGYPITTCLPCPRDSALLQVREAWSEGNRCPLDRTPPELSAHFCPHMLCLAGGTNSRQGIKDSVAQGK